MYVCTYVKHVCSQVMTGCFVYRENDVLRDQLKQYVTMIQAQDLHSQPQQEDEQLPTPTEENSRDLDNASAMEEHLQGKLSEVSFVASGRTPERCISF